MVQQSNGPVYVLPYASSMGHAMPYLNASGPYNQKCRARFFRTI